jgi:hypothetical protein
MFLQDSPVILAAYIATEIDGDEAYDPKQLIDGLVRSLK